MSPETALTKAILDILGADAAVFAIVGERLYDQVPADRAPGEPPFVEIGPINRSRFEGCGTAWLIRVRLYATSVDYGRVQAWTLADAMIAALDDDPARGVPTLPAPYVIMDSLRFVQAGDVVDPLQVKSVFVDLQAVVARAS